MTIRAMTNRVFVLAIVLSLITMVSAYVSFEHNGEARAALARQVEFWRLGRSLTGGVERLNTATIRYTLSGRDIYYETFWNELLITRALDRALDGFEGLGSTEYEANLIDSAREQAQELVEILKEVINAVADGEQTTARMLLFSPRFDKHLDNMMQFVYALHNKVERQTSIRVERAEAAAQIFSVLSLILLIVTTAILLLMIVVFFGHKVVRPLAAITTSVDRLAAGQLDVPVPYQQEQTEIGAVARAITVFKGYSQRNESLLREMAAAHKELADKSSMLEQLSNQLSKYLSPQVYESIFTGKQEVKVTSRRKKLTVFFSDIAGFTETTDNLEAEELSNLLNHYLTEMSNIALEYGATIDKFIGDAMLLFFGDPESKGAKEDAKSCVMMAIAMQRRMRELEKEWRDRGLERPFRVRIGIATGFCTVGNFGSQDRMDYTIIGNQVNLAARLESSAEPGAILIAHETHSLAKDVILAEEQPPLTVKGFDKPIHCYKVVGIYDDLAEEGRIVRHQKHGIQVFVDPDKLTGDDRGEAIEALKEALAKLEN